MGSFILKTFLQFLFLITPFFVLSMFLSMTQGWDTAAKKKLAIKVGISAFITCVFLLFFGRWLFAAFDITIDAFRIGGGALLFLSAASSPTTAAVPRRWKMSPASAAWAIFSQTRRFSRPCIWKTAV